MSDKRKVNVHSLFPMVEDSKMKNHRSKVKVQLFTQSSLSLLKAAITTDLIITLKRCLSRSMDRKASERNVPDASKLN